jgi:hypothetical protein
MLNNTVRNPQSRTHCMCFQHSHRSNCFKSTYLQPLAQRAVIFGVQDQLNCWP